MINQYLTQIANRLDVVMLKQFMMFFELEKHVEKDKLSKLYKDYVEILAEVY